VFKAGDIVINQLGSGGVIGTAYGDGNYYCRSNGASMGTGGCLASGF